MGEWLFLGERSEAGITFQLGLSRSTGQHYRFEPLATKPRGNLVGMIRYEIESRKSLVGEELEQAIFPVVGPIFFEGQYWLGWKERKGQNIFGPEKRAKQSAIKDLADLYPLINSYYLWYGAGLIIGRPEWFRLSKGDKGIFMPDPQPLSYLAKPTYNFIIALERCRSAEEYHNQPLGHSSDIFYLGMIIYYYITGESPFLLHKGWPTRAILNGAAVNPQVYRPNLPSDLGQMILSMLHPEPVRRPTIQTVKETWHNHLMKPTGRELDLIEEQPKRVGLDGWHTLIKAFSKWVFPISIIGLLGVVFLVLFHPESKSHSKISPLKTAAMFYREMEYVNLQGEVSKTTPSLSNDFRLAAKLRLEMVMTLLSKPLFKVDQMKLIDDKTDTSIVEADLIWWEWVDGGWTQRKARERLFFQKRDNKLNLIRRSPIHQY